MKPSSFEVAFTDGELADLRDRLTRTRWAPELGNEDWGYGTSGAYLRELVAYWVDGFDWRAQERAINKLSHYRVELDGIPLHFVHERGKGPSPKPLVLTHGWPWTFWDWHEVIPRLTDPAAFGGDPADSFDVIVPSLPGYGFSNPLPRTGVSLPVVGELWDRLMRQVLGYDRYGAAGGDWGAFVTADLGARFAQSLMGVYMSFPPLGHVGGMENVRPEDYAPEEAGWFARSQRRWWTTTPTHLTVHTSDPQTLAWALNDSPVGLASWLLERRHNWCDGDFEKAFTRDFLLTTVNLYWLTESIGPSLRLYADTFPAGLRLPIPAADAPPPQAPPRIEAPTGIGVFPGEVALLPRKACEQAANLVHWSVLPEGGHFGPAEQPAVYAGELQTFFRSLR